MLISGLKKRHDIVLSYEQTVARAVALSALRPKKISVWEMLIPILFVFGYLHTKERRELFSQNLLFTKKMALKAVFDMLKKNQTQDDVWAQIQSQTGELLNSVSDEMYSDEIRQAQLEEIDLLIAHYRGLLTSQGNDYGSLVVATYQTLDNYTGFLEQLQRAEEKVARAATNTLGQRTDIGTLNKIEAASRRIRLRQAEKIFNADPGLENAQ